MTKSIYTYFPLILFALVWSVVIFFASLEWFNIKPIKFDTWFLLFSGLLAYISGYILFVIYDKKFTQLHFTQQTFELNEPLIVKTILIFFAVSLVGTFLIMYSLGNVAGSGISTYFTKPINIRRAYVDIQANPFVPAPFTYKIGSYITNFAFVANLLGGVLLTSQKKIKWFGFLPFLAALISSFAIFGRFAIMTSLGFLFLSYLIFSFFHSTERRKKLLRNLFISTVLTIGALYYLFYYIVLARYSIELDLQEFFNKTIYFYFSGGVSALDHFLKYDINHSYGTSSFRSIFKWLVRLGLWPDDTTLSPYDQFFNVSPSMQINTYTYIRSLYVDFGLPGVLAFSFIWGSLTKTLLKKVYQRFNFLNLYFAIIFIYGSLLTFYSFYFESLTLIIFWVIPLVLFRKHFQNCIVKK